MFAFEMRSQDAAGYDIACHSFQDEYECCFGLASWPRGRRRWLLAAVKAQSSQMGMLRAKPLASIHSNLYALTIFGLTQRSACTDVTKLGVHGAKHLVFWTA